jgi:alkanesulfonate monooxygenase SsuD/methylene tetrahydromethanopterin reductase-like flavin-dependent oxidoreductase (luciferase family)
MEIGIGLPNAVPDTRGSELVEWARLADEAGFSALGTIDRIVYPNYDAIAALSAAAAVSQRIRLATTVILGPLRQNAALLAKQALTIDAIAGGGRFVLGIAIGAREDDYEVSRVSMGTRGAWLDQALEDITRIWAGEGEPEARMGPRPDGGGPRLMVGGGVAASFDRAARYGDGWIMSGGTPEMFAESLPKLDEAWRQHGREGEPKKMTLAYFSLGPDAERNAQAYLLDYYAWLGDEMSAQIAASAARDADTAKAYVAAFESTGCDELILFPCASDPAQVGLLAEALGM